MAKKRLGKSERAIRRFLFEVWRAVRHAIVSENRRHISNLETSKGYATASHYERAMTHGLYRGLYDPTYSTDKNTRRGLKKPKLVSMSAAIKAGHSKVRFV